MIRIEIVPLSKATLSFTVFNEYNQVIKHKAGKRELKDKIVATIRRGYMKEGKSVFCSDMS